MRIVQVGLIALAVTTSGCRPLYGGKPEKLVAPPKKKRPAGAERLAAASTTGERRCTGGTVQVVGHTAAGAPRCVDGTSLQRRIALRVAPVRAALATVAPLPHLRWAIPLRHGTGQTSHAKLFFRRQEKLLG